MPQPVFTALLFGCVMSVPVAAFAVASLYRRAGFGIGWTATLHVVGAISALGVIAFVGGFAGQNGGNATGMVTIFVTAIFVTSMALGLAFRKWPSDN